MNKVEVEVEVEVESQLIVLNRIEKLMFAVASSCSGLLQVVCGLYIDWRS